MVSGVDRNFALESYGAGSRCFDHTEQMWEERSCSQVRQWQHWGSGCYNYNCQDGRLQIVVLNHTYTCFYAGQQLEVRLRPEDDDWLHTGSLVCPSCEEVCGPEAGCRPGVSPPLSHNYPEHLLTCGQPPLSLTPVLGCGLMALWTALRGLQP